MDGKIHTYKEILVTKVYKKIYDVDYDETFSPIAMVKYVKILLVIATYHDYKIWKMDVKTSLLNGNLFEDVYMTQPKELDVPQEAQ